MIRYLISRYWYHHSSFCPRFVIRYLTKRWYEHPNYNRLKGTRESCLRDAGYALLTGNRAIFRLEMTTYHNWPLKTIEQEQLKQHHDFLKRLK